MIVEGETYNEITSTLYTMSLGQKNQAGGDGKTGGIRIFC